MVVEDGKAISNRVLLMKSAMEVLREQLSLISRMPMRLESQLLLLIDSCNLLIAVEGAILGIDRKSVV